MDNKTEIWRDVVGFEGFYQISNSGNVRSLDRTTRNRSGSFIKKGKNLTIRLDACGYCVVTLRVGKNFIGKIHRMIAAAFIPNPNKYPMINHINGIKTDNRIDNLEWCDAKRNVTHSRQIGLNRAYGENCPSSKLTELEVLHIRESCLNKSISVGDLSHMYNVSASNILSIKYRKSWRHI